MEAEILKRADKLCNALLVAAALYRDAVLKETGDVRIADNSALNGVINALCSISVMCIKGPESLKLTEEESREIVFDFKRAYHDALRTVCLKHISEGTFILRKDGKP